MTINKTIKAIKRLWRLGTCSHRGAMNWSIIVGDSEMHFCRRCGRLLVACDPSDQPQHNPHWLDRDQLDDKGEQSILRPWGEENSRLFGVNDGH